MKYNEEYYPDEDLKYFLEERPVVEEEPPQASAHVAESHPDPEAEKPQRSWEEIRAEALSVGPFFW